MKRWDVVSFSLSFYSIFLSFLFSVYFSIHLSFLSWTTTHKSDSHFSQMYIELVKPNIAFLYCHINGRLWVIGKKHIVKLFTIPLYFNIHTRPLFREQVTPLKIYFVRLYVCISDIFSQMLSLLRWIERRATVIVTFNYLFLLCELIYKYFFMAYALSSRWCVHRIFSRGGIFVQIVAFD